jgi:hypothetical protein
LGEARAKPAGRAGHQRDFALEIKEFRSGHRLTICRMG